MKIKSIFFCFILFCFAGCSAFTSYPDVTSSARNAFENGDFDSSLAKYSEGLNDNLDGVCYKLESGLVSHTAGNYKNSIKFFSDAERRIDEFRMRATISASDMGEETGAVTINEKMIPYKGEFFERTLLHTYQALNYLLLGNAEDARVEIKRAEMSQQQAQDEYQQELAASREESRRDQNPKLTENLKGELDRRYTIPRAYLSDSSNVYQLGCTYYLGSLVYELMGEYDDAEIDLNKLYQINPHFMYGKNMHSGDRGMGSVVVFYQCDRGPYKEEVSFTIPTGPSSFQKVAFPVYKLAPTVADHMELTIGGQTYPSSPLVDINAVSLRYHRDKSLVRAIRMGIRLGLKIAAQYAARESFKNSGKKKGKHKEENNEAGELAAFATSVLTSVTEQADERSWMTLPRSIQCLRVYLPAGEHEAIIRIKSGYGTLNTINIGRVKVYPSNITFIDVRSIDSRVFCNVSKKITP